MKLNKRVGTNPDVYELTELGDIKYGDYIMDSNGNREAWQLGAPASQLIKTTQFSDFVLMIGEDSYETLSASTNKKAIWMMKVWSGSNIVDPNDSEQMEALVLMKNNGLISDDNFATIAT